MQRWPAVRVASNRNLLFAICICPRFVHLFNHLRYGLLYIHGILGLRRDSYTNLIDNVYALHKYYVQRYKENARILARSGNTHAKRSAITCLRFHERFSPFSSTALRRRFRRRLAVRDNAYSLATGEWRSRGDDSGKASRVNVEFTAQRLRRVQS